MKVTSVEIIEAKHYLFVKVHTDAGITGLGEAGNWGFLQATKGAIEKFSEFLIHFYIIRPASEKKPLPFVVNIHGGGMIRCHGDRDILFARRLAYASDCAVVSIDYHLAPQYFYPYQIDETEILINHLLQNAAQYHLRQNYILSGQSSGGNIACMASW